MDRDCGCTRPSVRFPRVAAAGWAGFEGQFADGGVGAAAFGGVEDGRALVGFDHADGGLGVGVFVEHGVFFLQNDERAFVAHHAFAVVAETVAVDRRIGNDEFLAGIFDFGLLFIGVIAGLGEFVHAVDVIFALAVGGREKMATADSLNGKGQGFFVLGIDRADKDAGGVELMAAEFGHEAAAGAKPETPTDKLFERIDLLVVGKLPRTIAVAGASTVLSSSCLLNWTSFFCRASSCVGLADFKASWHLAI